MIRSLFSPIAALLVASAPMALAQDATSLSGTASTLPAVPAPPPPSARPPQPAPPPQPAQPVQDGPMLPPAAVTQPSPPSERPAPQAEAIDPAEVSDLRTAYDDLRARDAAAAGLSNSISTVTQAELDSLSAQAATLDSRLERAAWTASNMAWFADNLQQRGATSLPDGTPTGMTAALDLALVGQGALYYHSALPFRNETLKGAFAARSVVLRVAQAPGVELIWVPNEGYAFMSGQSLEVYK